MSIPYNQAEFKDLLKDTLCFSSKPLSMGAIGRSLKPVPVVYIKHVLKGLVQEGIVTVTKGANGGKRHEQFTFNHEAAQNVAFGRQDNL